MAQGVKLLLLKPEDLGTHRKPGVIFVYTSACFGVGVLSSLQISKMNTSILLKED